MLLALNVSLNAQTTGKIAGRVTDASTGEGLLMANVIVENSIMGAATDREGEYYIINLSPGIYTLIVRMMGYGTQRVENIRVSVGLTTRMDFELESAVVETGDVIVVTAERSKIQKDLTSSERSVGAEEIDQMPVRSVNELVELQAGVVKDAGGNLHIRGGRTNEITYMIDGVQVMNPLYRTMGVSIDDQAIQELKAITGTFNAEYGQALSGVVNIVTKKGSDKFALNATAYFGDHLSFDRDHYYVMDNTEWAQQMAYTLNRGSFYSGYDFSQHDIYSGDDIYNAIESQEKPWLEKNPTLNTFEPWKHKDIQLNISGPVPGTKKRISFFLSGRYQYSPGFNMGKRYFMPWGFQSPVSDTVNTFKQADNAIVPLGWFEGISTQSKVHFRITNNLTFNYGIYYNRNRSYSTGDENKYVPDGGKNFLTDRYTQIVSMTYVFSKSTFLDLRGSYYVNNHEEHLYDDPFDYRYMPTLPGDFEQYVFNPSEGADVSVSTTPNDFNYWGNDPEQERTFTNYLSLKMDLTHQMTKRHLFKAGIVGRLHDLDYDQYNIQFSQANYRPIIPDDSSPFHTHYTADPYEFAAYIQDKIEYNSIIINLGLRFDYFDSRGRILADPMDPQIYSPFKIDHVYKNYTPTTPDSQLVEYSVAEREEFWYDKPTAKYQLSPRFGLSFPITDKGVIHFSYGHFFQNPEFRYLYHNPNFWVTGAGSENLVGNADLEAERTVMYEVGVQQEMTSNFYAHVTGFYRDIRDWVGSGFPINTYRGLTYYKYVNKDHATSKGVTLSLAFTASPLTINLDYTFMTAKGTSSDPRDAYNDLAAQRSPRVQMIDLDWDQQHSLNIVANYNYRGWTATLVGNMNSGLPYTPEFSRGEATGGSAFIGLRENSERMPLTYNLDLRISRQFRVGSLGLQVFANVTNLFDTRNARYVYADTGTPEFTLQSYLQRNRFWEIGSIDEYYTRPGMYSNPRFIQLGMRISVRG